MEGKRKMNYDVDVDFEYGSKRRRPSLCRWQAIDIDDEQSIPRSMPEDAEEIPSISDGTDHTDAHESSVQTTDEEMEEQTTQITQYYRSKSKDSCTDMDENDEMIDNDLYQYRILQSLLNLMRPGETVSCAVKRLAAAVISNKPKQRFKQRKACVNEAIVGEDSKKTKLLLEEITGLIDRFLMNNELDIYQQTYEDLQMKLSQMQRSLRS